MRRKTLRSLITRLGACGACTCAGIATFSRVLVHAGASNLGLFMRHLTGIGTPRSQQRRAAAILALGLAIYAWLTDHARTIATRIRQPAAHHAARVPLQDGLVVNLSVSTCATGC